MDAFVLLLALIATPDLEPALRSECPESSVLLGDHRSWEIRRSSRAYFLRAGPAFAGGARTIMWPQHVSAPEPLEVTLAQILRSDCSITTLNLSNPGYGPIWKSDVSI